jgi:class 3 adenylate cyclase
VPFPVNAYFAKLIDGINKFAGDVIKFAGDALQVIWRNRPDGIQDSAATLMLRSAACCLYLLQAPSARPRPDPLNPAPRRPRTSP